jgi:conserved oligomeric Golgi complex subunit 2
MSNKRMPTEPSYFVSSILRPVKNFFAIETSDGPGALLKDNFLKQCATEVCENVFQRCVDRHSSCRSRLIRYLNGRYIYYLTAMKKTEESLKRLKKGRQSAFSLFGGGNSSSGSVGNEEDEERIRVQMRLDVELFGKDARLLGVDLTASEGFKELAEVVQLDVS